MQILILEDNDERRQQMQAAIQGRFPQYELQFFISASEMLDALSRTDLHDVVLIGLDHDLELLSSEDGILIDPGDGREVADYLARQTPSCPIIIHTTNSHAGDGMQAVLQESGWTTSRVVPYGDLEWISQAWFPAVRNALVGGAIKPASVDQGLQSSRMSNSFPWCFPDERNRIYEEASRFRQLSSSERLERIFDLIAFGQSFLASSPNRDAARRLREQDEQEWRRRFRELFARYESRIRTTATRSEDGAA